MNGWEQRAAGWNLLGPPLRPSTSDLAVIERWMLQRSREIRQRADTPLRVLILGATPEYHALPWPTHTQLLAVDYTQAMLDKVWPGPTSTTLCANWLDLTPALGRFDLVLGDGCLMQLNWPDQHRALAQVVHRLLYEDGLLLLRNFVRDADVQDFDTTLRRLRAAAPVSIDVVKLHLWMALQATPEQGVSPPVCWQRLLAAVGDMTALAAMCGLDAPTLRTHSDQYLNDSRRFHLANGPSLGRLFCEAAAFELLEYFVPDYAMGSHCPTMVWRARSTPDQQSGGDSSRD